MVVTFVEIESNSLELCMLIQVKGFSALFGSVECHVT